MPDPARAAIQNPLDVQRGAYDLAEYIASVLNKALPKGFRAKLTITLDGGTVQPHNVGVEFRSPQELRLHDVKR